MDHRITNSTWMENSIGINGNEVVEIFIVLRRNNVAGSVGVCESVQKCLKTTRQKLNKRILCRVLSTSAENRMLQDVGNTSRVFGRRAECDSKHFIVVIGGNTQQLGTRLFVAVQGGGSSVFFNKILLDNFVGGMLDIGLLCEIQIRLDGGTAHLKLHGRGRPRGAPPKCRSDGKVTRCRRGHRSDGCGERKRRDNSISSL
mmetsp:Transcript_17734/g.44245  ORF Transcript_17734/g.44245 Transcript_17734/m.44245 type:complete len:201 (+) Transcript_17734:2721-3323(+)